MDRADHFIPCNFECRAVVDGGGRGQAKSRHCRKSSLPNKITCGEERYGGLLAALGNDGEPCPALLQVEDGVGWIPLGEEGLPFLQFDDFSAEAGLGQESGKIKYRVCAIALQDTLSLRTAGLQWPVNDQEIPTLELLSCDSERSEERRVGKECRSRRSP